MLFSSISFLYYFLPVVLILYFAVPKRKTMFWANLILFVSSLFFYFWGEPKLVIFMLGSIVLGYISGLIIASVSRIWIKKTVLIFYITAILGILAYYKYAGFFTENLSKIFSNIPILKIALPIGISFYTFQIISYAIDVYRETTEAQKDFVAFGAYISMFPQLIAGPIVRYSDIAQQLKSRKTTYDDIQTGITLFLIGLSKKVLIANQLGEFCNIFRASNEKSVIFYWLYAIAYALHVFFDFSGYSNMAIGLGKMFGFQFMENFNYPFISRSITEFWRRWHISLGTWFRDYVYIPLGGNRVKPARHILNILIVWVLTGFWHGAEWTFLVWGFYYACLLILEKLITMQRLEKIPVLIRHLSVSLLTLFGFVLFAAENLTQAGSDITAMLTGSGLPMITGETVYYLQSYAVVFGIAVIASTPLFVKLLEKINTTSAGRFMIQISKPVILIVLLLLCTAYLVDGSFNPFLYFRF